MKYYFPKRSSIINIAFTAVLTLLACYCYSISVKSIFFPNQKNSWKKSVKDRKEIAGPVKIFRPFLCPNTNDICNDDSIISPAPPVSIIQKFAIIGDFGLASSNEAAVADLVKSWNPDYIVSLGDNNYELGESITIDTNIGLYYHDYIYPYTGRYGTGADSNRFFPCIGNHDINTNNGEAYYQYFTLPGNERYYDYVKGNIHFFVLNSNPNEADGIDSSSIQAVWLKNKLQNSTSKWNVVYFHHPPYCSDAGLGSQTIMQWTFKKWGADVVLAGHSHVYERLLADGIPYFVNGVGGRNLHSFNQIPLPESRFRYNSDYGAMLCNEYSDSLTFLFYNKGGLLIDNYSLTKIPPVLAVVVSSPANNSAFPFGIPITISAVVEEGKVGIKKVDFFSADLKIGTDSIYPYSFSWTNAQAGNYSITALVIDNSNDSVLSVPSNITVNNPIFTCTASGTITRDFWANVTGSTVAKIPVNTVPTSTSQLNIFEEPSKAGDNFGSRLRGFICPPSTGNYIFWIASDDNSELWLSTNDLPANKVKIASVSGYTASRQWTKYPSQQSAPINLIEGHKYYIEALHKESTLGDNSAVGWQLPNGALERPIPGTRLSPFAVPYTASISSPANNTSFNAGSNITIQAAETGGTGTIQKVEFFAGTVKLGEDLTSPYSFTWNNVSAALYALTAKVTDSGNNTAVSAITNITVTNTLSAAITSPANNTSITAGSNITIQATGAGGTGTIQKVEFFAGAVKLGEDFTSPYSFTWNNVSAALYALTAKVTDSGNNTAVSAVTNITVNPVTSPIPAAELISAGSSWKYLDNGTNQGTNWRAAAFNDAAWKTGNSELGYGDGGESTVVSYGPSSTKKYITTYFRKTFNVTDKSIIPGLELSLIRDDGAVVYINGVEVYRNNLPTGTINYNTLAPLAIDGINESAFVIANISSASLVNGTNVIAVEIHQNAVTSSDISFNLKLSPSSALKILVLPQTADSLEQNAILENSYNIIVYPNPNRGHFTMEFCIDHIVGKTVAIEIINSIGQVVYINPPQKANGCIKEFIEIESSLPVGVYIMKVTIDDKIQTSKLLLTR